MTTAPANRRSTPDEAAHASDLARSAIVRLREVRKSFGEQVVLDRLSLDIERGKTTVVLGPSGCGKSVMLKHIVGLLRPDSGEIFYEDKRIDDLDEDMFKAVRLEIGLLFQMSALFDSMTVEENLAFPLIEHTRLTRAERRDKIAEALKMVDLDNVQHKLPAQLSGGQRKRVALARVIVTRPKVILYDEPTTGLDPIRSDGINELVLRMRDRLGVTNLVVTHDLISARKIADRVVMLLDGKIAAMGTFADLESSRNPRVQHFLSGTYDPRDQFEDKSDRPTSDELAVGATGEVELPAILKKAAERAKAKRSESKHE
jgi:phospholipid/cholesterol/gamma-HCH transport system ATP-binding protein